MIRLVLDTNTLISAVGWRDSNQRKILEACLFKKYLLIAAIEVLECAMEEKAHYIITGDRHLLNLKQFGKTAILTASEFLQKE